MNIKMVRLTNICIKNFKNVVSGELSLKNPRKNYKSSVLGVYGQNGSGKTALIDSIELLQYALRGTSIPDKFADYINTEADKAMITYDFIIETESEKYDVSYQISIKSLIDETMQNIGVINNTSSKVSIVNETVKCPILTEKKIRLGRLMDTDGDDVFSPVSKKDLLVGKDKGVLTDLFVAKRMTNASSRSFVFSRELLTAIHNRVNHVDVGTKEFEELRYYWTIIEALVEYGNHFLFVVNTSNSGLISLNIQPLIFKYVENNQRAQGVIMLQLDAPTLIAQREMQMVGKLIESMNIVMKQMIPGLTIGIKNLGSQVMENGVVGSSVQLMSCRNGREIALKYESDGIKKIFCILQLLIVVYNNPSITVAIDELDSGVFEYLLGEILRIISEKGKGQLIFTSHNLRPLETIDRGFIAFTTTNPNNRYIRMEYVKENNNLRDFYYRDIMLGEQDEELYETTDNAEIAFAFREAGEISGT